MVNREVEEGTNAKNQNRNSEKLLSQSMIFWGSLSLGIFEIVLVFLSLLPGALLITKAIQLQSVFLLCGAVGLAYYIFQFVIIIGCGLALRLIPKPVPGLLTNSKDEFMNFVIIGISFYLMRSPAYKLALTTPFPGALFFWLAGGRCEGMLGANVSISEPHLISIGKGSTIGVNSFLTGHIKNGYGQSIVEPIKIGENVLIGEGTSIHPGVVIGNHAIVAEKSLVKPGTVIGSHEVWGGVPAKKLK